MSGKRYPEEFKTEAVKQVVDGAVILQALRHLLDITTHSLCLDKEVRSDSTNKEQSDAQANPPSPEELKRVTDERDIKKAAAYFAKLSD